MSKIVIYSHSAIWYCINKLRWGCKLKCNFANAINGKLKLRLNKHSQIDIQGKIYIDGPVYFNTGISSELIIGSRCYFNRNCSVTALKKIEIGTSCLFGNNVVIVDHNHLYNNKRLQNEFETKEIQIGDNVWVGANSTITAGVSIGSNTIIGANSVVTKSIPGGY